MELDRLTREKLWGRNCAKEYIETYLENDIYYGSIKRFPKGGLENKIGFTFTMAIWCFMSFNSWASEASTTDNILGDREFLKKALLWVFSVQKMGR